MPPTSYTFGAWILSLFAAAALAMLLPAESVASKPGQELTGAVEAAIPMTNWGGRPVVDLEIDGKGPFRFILDTGASVTVIDRKLADRLALPEVGETEIGSPLGGTVTAKELSLPDVNMAGLGLGNLRALAFDLFGEMGGDDMPVGVLASNAFTGHSLIFDFPRAEIRVSADLLPPADGREVFDFCSPDGKPSLTVDVAGNKFCVHLDTGSPGDLTLPLSAAEMLSLESEPVVMGNVRLIGKEMSILGASLVGDLQVGTMLMPNPEIGFLEGAPVGNLGQGILMNSELAVDHENSRLRLRLSSSPGKPQAKAGPIRMRRGPARKRYGMRFEGIGGDELVVIQVDAGSPAELGGLAKEDRILEMNGAVVSSMTQEERIAALQNTPLALRVDRQGEIREFGLTLE